MSALTRSRQSPQLPPCPSPLLTLSLKKKIKFSFTRGKYSQKTEGEGTSHCTHTDSHGLDDAFPSSGASAYSAEEIYVCEESCQFLLVRKDTGTRKPILSTASEK